jgi:UDP-GlcNAc:undecaprenyl-phosphate/decaprenyl-phosphate GlcNAc-1-phosphate transferase
MTYISVFFSTILLNIFYQKYFLKKGFTDKVNHRSSHKVSATRSGGLVLFSVLVLYTSYLYISGLQPYDFSIFIPISFLFITGLYDDIYKVDFELKFLLQLIVAKVLIDQGYIFNQIDIMGVIDITFNRFFAQVFTIIFFVSIFNAYNFIDGIDGNVHFEGVKSLIIILLISTASFEFYNLVIYSIIILSTNLFFNLKKNKKVFMGDSGSLLIGILIVIFSFEATTNKIEMTFNSYFLIIFLYPIIDLTRIVIIRLVNKKSPFKADTNHIHHKINFKLDHHLKSSILILLVSLSIQSILFYLTSA